MTLPIILGVTLIPILIEQLNQLVTRLPAWVESRSQQLKVLQHWAVVRGLPINFSNLISQLEKSLPTQLPSFGGEILVFLPNAIGRVFDWMLTIVMAFYLLLHGKRIWNGVFRWLPLKYRAHIRQSLQQNFRNYFLSQVTLAMLMGAAMTIAFLLLQIPFGLLFGLGIEMMAFFPFGTPVGIVLVSFLTALKSIWLGVKVVVVGTLIDQAIENGIAPLLIRRLTGLNPMWVLLSLLIGIKVGGFLGLVVAVPLASFIKSMMEDF